MTTIMIIKSYTQENNRTPYTREKKIHCIAKLKFYNIHKSLGFYYTTLIFLPFWIIILFS